MSAEDFVVWRNLAIIPFIVLALHLLFVAQCREWVKTDLRQRSCKPVSVRYRPFAWWVIWGPAFRVSYVDLSGALHRAECGVPAWHRPVVWRWDERTDRS